MEPVLHRIRTLYESMGPGERRIADFIVSDPREITRCSIVEVAERCSCGSATVVRFARHLGFEGYQELKVGIAEQLSATSQISSEITAKDTCFDMFQKRIHDIGVTLSNTDAVLDPQQLEKAALAISTARRVLIFGLGNSAAIAMDAAHKLLRLGLDAHACCDNHIQAIVASHADPHCVAVGISHSGASRDVVEALRLAKMNGAQTICITNYGSSPIVETSDIHLFTRSEETRHSILALNSRIAQLAIFDTIYTYIVVNANQAATQAIHNTEIALQNKKY